MKLRNGSKPEQQTSGSRMASAFMDPEAEAGFAKQIYKLTGPGDTIMDIMARTILTPGEADIIGTAWRRGMRIAQDPESPYNAEKLMTEPIEKLTGLIPVPILWVISKCVPRLSVNGYNADRVLKMHVQPNILPAGGVDRYDKLRQGVDAVRGD